MSNDQETKEQILDALLADNPRYEHLYRDNSAFAQTIDVWVGSFAAFVARLAEESEAWERERDVQLRVMQRQGLPPIQFDITSSDLSGPSGTG